MKPHHYKKRILLAVSGMSPQIVTETLYSLAQAQNDAFIPTEIHLITTKTSAQEARLQLLHPKTGKFLQLCSDYQLNDISFPESHIHIIEDYAGNQLDDIKTPQQNQAAADFITNIVSQMTRDEKAALHVSIAGGRKTMGFYLGYALSLFGRPQDRLSHVLVSDGFEGLKDFFYPTPDSFVIEDRNGRSLDTKNAEVILAEIPFVRMRNGIPQHLLEGKASFNESVKFVRQMEAEPHLAIDIKNQCLWVNDTQIKLQFSLFSFYLWLLERSIDGNPITRPAENVSNPEYSEEFLAFSKRLLSAKDDKSRTESALKSGIEGKWMSEKISRINKDIKNAIGEHAAQNYVVNSIGNNNNKTYQINLLENQISYKD